MGDRRAVLVRLGWVVVDFVSEWFADESFRRGWLSLFR